MNSMSNEDLSSTEAAALFDILIHHETYAEIRDFRYERAIHEYGPPFQKENVKPGTPILQALVTRFVLPLPGLRDVSAEFWQGRVEPLIAALSAANLSESYDKGVLGQRKTCSTAISALIEYPARGFFGGYTRQDAYRADGKYDLQVSDDIVAAWDDFRQQLVYGTLLEEVFEKIAQTDKLEEHPLLTQAVHRFIVANLASIIHYTLIVSPKGQSLLSLLESAHKLVPYAIIRQTLKIGNVATMISGMVKIVLAKASIAAVTNWLGISKGADEGQNLVQTIISTVLGWDNSKLRKRAAHIENTKQGLSKEQLHALKEYASSAQEEQEQYRARSESQSESIINTILSSASIDTELTTENHALALEYVNLILSIRDREELINALCKHHPDLLTPIARDLVTAYEPIIRAVHNAVDLSSTLYDAQMFLDDLIKLSKPKSGKDTPTPPPSVEDYIKLLEKHQSSCHRFLHQAVKNDAEIRKNYTAYGHTILSAFRTPQPEQTSKTETSSPKKPTTTSISTAMHTHLNSLFRNLSASDQNLVREEIHSRKTYLETLSAASTERINALLSHRDKTARGAGMYLAHWQTLLDNTKLTPNAPHGSIRYGRDIDAKKKSREGVDGEKMGAAVLVEDDVQSDLTRAPSMQKTVALMSGPFWEVLREPQS